MALKLLIPLFLVGGGVALVLSNAKANEKKKRVNAALDLGLDEPDDIDQPPLPPAMKRAFSTNPVNRETFNAWWQQTEWVQNGVMGFWIDADLPAAGTEWLLPGAEYLDAVVGTNDGSFWYFDDGWHPAERMAQDYDAWYEAGT